MNIETVQVGVDFSRASSLALEHARLIASRLSVRLVLRHAFYMPWPFSAFADTDLAERSEGWQSTAAQIRIDRKKELQALAKKLHSSGLDASTLFDDGEPSRVLLAGRSRKDILILGHRGTNPMSRLLVGNVAETIATRAGAPTLFVKAPPDAGGFQHVVVATHLTGQQQDEMHLASTLASNTAEIEIVHALQPGELPFGFVSASNDLRSFFDDAEDAVLEQLELLIKTSRHGPDQKLRATCLPSPPRETLLASCGKERSVDLLVIGRRAARQRLGSLALWALRHLSCSVLIVPEPTPNKLFDEEPGSPHLAMAQTGAVLDGDAGASRAEASRAETPT